MEGSDVDTLEGAVTAMTHGKAAVTTSVSSPQGSKRKPLPPLIPLQAKGPKLANSPPLSERDLNEICAKSCPTSALKDFAPLIGDADAFQTREEEPKKESPSPPPSPTLAKPNGKASPKKKSGTFFDKLKEKLATDGQAGLVCSTCGLEARCLSELVLHQQQQHGQEQDATGSATAKSLLSSRSRCPHCRHRCKSSADLVQHLKGCRQSPSHGQAGENGNAAGTCANRETTPHPMENKVFVWNNMPSGPESDEEPDSNRRELEFNDGIDDSTVVRLVGVETAPGYGSVTPSSDGEQATATPQGGPTSIKKVFKCPHCSFWASTASRFHVHIVGHLNRKPFECSLCAYRSNWRWDITKHIRLKSARDPSHERARLLMTDETGRRNYSKYNKHLTLMRVTEQKMDITIPGTRQSKAAANGTQGNVAPGTSETISILPAPPKLTRAPVLRNSARAAPIPTAPVLRPPPPLQAAAHVLIVNSASKQPEKPEEPVKAPTLKKPAPQELAPTLKRPAPQEPETEAKRANTDNKKTVWRCKQCYFRDGDRAVVLAHVKGHYRLATGGDVEASVEFWQGARWCDYSQGCSACDCQDYLCGCWKETDRYSLCYDDSMQKHVLQQRQGRSKEQEKTAPNDETATAKPNQEDETQPKEKKTSNVPPVLEPNGVHACDSCKFTTNSLATLAAHSEFHKPHVDAIFKCYFCPYYVQTKEELLQHMVVHGVSQDEEFVQKTVMIKVTSPLPCHTPADSSSPSSPSEPTTSTSTPVTSTASHSASTPTKSSSPVGNEVEEKTPSPSKRYSCSGCPYVSNSKSQFLYHKQFHRPRGAVFKCSLCSYNVSRRHLLHQHLKVHGIMTPSLKASPEKGEGSDAASTSEAMDVDVPETSEAPETREAPAEEPFAAVDTKDLKDIPVCWILRNSKILKMFKCRFCPHVNLRRTNIQEHERMHSDRPARPWESVQPHQRLTCELCTYTCNNAGVLSSHMKVHLVDYARVCALVDPYRKDDEQFKELSDKVSLTINSAAADTSAAEANETEPESPAENKDLGSVEESNINIPNLPKSNVDNPTVNGVKSPEKSNVQVDVDAVKRTGGEMDELKETDKILRFCQTCPARFLYFKELSIHSRFHNLKLAHQCEGCTYAARQDAQLQAHFKVHTDEYQDRTKLLLKMFPVHPDYPMPLHTCVTDSFNKMWIVPSDEATVNAAMTLISASGASMETRQCGRLAQADERASENITPDKSDVPSGPRPKHNCTKCPAKFFKSVALQYHLTLHGGNHPHKCRVCDYAVKTYGNLAKHEMIHGPREKLSKRYAQREPPPPMTVPISGTELFQQRSEAQKRKLSEKNDQTDVDDAPHPEEPEALGGNLFHGSPDFVYPTYLKNGRLKEKRYKCHKCPSAFEKREQYRVHLSLHGSNQRYSCNKCDYSVKYYANYVQHLQKHSKSDEAKAAAEDSVPDRLASVEDNGGEDESEGVKTPEKTPRQSPVTALPQRSIKSINRGPLTLSVADRQTMMVMQQRRANRIQTNRDIDKNYWCLHCPYSNPRRDGIDSHMKRHIAVSGVRNNFTCDYCDYTVPTQHFLREHAKVHFAIEKLPRPDTFMTCDKMELWVDEESQEKKLIFQDKGSSAPDDRFAPLLNIVRDDVDLKKIFVNPSTGEIVNFGNGDVQLQQGNAHSEWDSCSESTNRSELAVVERNGQVFAASQSSLTSDVSDTASSAGASSTAGSDIDDDSTVRSVAATVNLTAADAIVTEATADVPENADADNKVALTSVGEN